MLYIFISSWTLQTARPRVGAPGEDEQHGDAIHGFAANAAFVDDESQFSTPNILERATLAKKVVPYTQQSELGFLAASGQTSVGQGGGFGLPHCFFGRQRPSALPVRMSTLRLRKRCCFSAFVRSMVEMCGYVTIQGVLFFLPGGVLRGLHQRRRPQGRQAEAETLP